MKRLLVIMFCAAALVPALPCQQARAEEPAAVSADTPAADTGQPAASQEPSVSDGSAPSSDQPQASQPGSDQSSDGVPPAVEPSQPAQQDVDQSPHQHGTHGGPDSHGGPDWWRGIHCRGDAECDAFRQNFLAKKDDPQAAAEELVKFLKSVPPDQRNAFIHRNYPTIIDTMKRLNQSSPQSFETVNKDISPYLADAGQWHPHGRRDGPPQAGISGGGQDLSADHEPRQGGGAAPSASPDASNAGVAAGSPVLELMKVDRMLGQGDTDAAAATLGRVQRANSDNPGVQSVASQYYNDIARDYGSRKNYAQAARNYEMAAQSASSAIQLDPENTEAYKNRALARMSLRDRKGAIEDVKKAMELDPQDESSKMLSALVDSRKGTTSLRSLATLQEMRKTVAGSRSGASAVKASPLNAAAGTQGTAAEAAQESVSLSEARAQESPAIELIPEEYLKAAAYVKTAASKNSLGDYKAAVKYADKALERDPSNSGAFFERAYANNQLGRYDEAIKDTTNIILKEPSNIQALNMRALAFNRKGLAKEAESDVNKAIDLDPGFAEAWINRALVYEKQGNYKRMLEDYRQAAALNGAYGSRFQDAVAQYSDRVPGFSPVPGKAAGGMTHFLVMLGFTLTGGLLVALGLLHIVTSSREKALADGKTPYPNTLAPSIFYEGVASGKYKIERKLGEGGMGIVYEALDQSLGRKVAIKRMNEEIKVNDREKQRFLEEARTLAMLHHPNIVEIHTIFEEDNDIYLVCEHVNGASLDKIVEKEVRLPFEKTRAIICEAAKALSYAHSKNVIHMDMKLSNIMISEENEVKVMDFGLARHMKESLARISSREVVGSPAYMPPEQDLGVSSKESDIYALGVCLYETLTGELPFKGPDFHYQKERMLYRPAGEIVPGLPAGIDAFIARALAVDPASRFQSAADFRKELMDM